MGFKITRKTPKEVSINPINDSTSSERIPGLIGVLKRHVKFLGPGIVASAAYYDPGNWATDLQAGSRFGNAHLFVLLVAIFIAVFLQILATRVGFISRKDIAQNCRASLDSGKARTARRWLLLYPLWVLFELGILFADMGELLGSATALILLFPRLPPWVAVLLTFPEVFLALLFFRNGKQSKKSIQIFEIMITVVVMTVVVSALVLFFKVKPNFVKIILGYIPSSALITGSSFYTAIGILGATVGPHSLFLGANMATLDRTSDQPPVNELPIEETMIHLSKTQTDPEKHGDALNAINYGAGLVSLNPNTAPKQRSVLECKSYLAHASFDIAASIFTLPLIVNSAILIVASTTFFYNRGVNQKVEEADLPAMHALLKTNLGAGFAALFAVSLWLSGNAASLTITMAGQSLSAGFLGYQTSPLIRRLITRTIGIIPAVIISTISSQKGLNDLLIASQVAISIVLPFAVIPLAYFSSNKTTMSLSISPKIGRLFTEDEINSVNKYRRQSPPIKIERGIIESEITEHLKSIELAKMKEFKISNPDCLHSFANHWVVVVIAIILILVILAANTYGIYQVASGN